MCMYNSIFYMRIISVSAAIYMNMKKCNCTLNMYNKRLCVVIFDIILFTYWVLKIGDDSLHN